ncbi:Neural cell adhesion molecule [Fasciola hepatica]|uniref:Neural cell adhesion molecule n=1 Tax=Fasciola hepatica TaxID=6192 RepID=A0A4E0S3N8_FASHE|nr:Neural cell adhesion molecule [Fasciola hepatica]
MWLQWLLILTTCLLGSECSSLQIDGVDESGRVFVQSGQNLALTCTHLALWREGSVLEWFVPSMPTEPVRPSQKTNVYWQDDVGRKRYILIVRSVGSDDSGRYTCRMGRQEGEQFVDMGQVHAEVIVQRSIVFTDCPQQQWIPTTKAAANRTDTDSIVIRPQQSATIRCAIQALPPPVVFWRFKGQPITTGPHYVTSNVGLMVFDPTEEDAGVYTVIAKQPTQTAVFDIRVSVFTQPRIIHGPVIVGPYANVMVSGYEAYLQCLAEGYPQPTIHWYRQRDPQTELQTLDAHKFFVNTNSRVGILRVVRAQYPEDSDVYICRAIVSVPRLYDDWKDAEAEAKLAVNVTLRPHLIPLTTMHQYVDVGDTVTVQCKVRATDPLKLYYQKLYSNWSYVNGIQPTDPRIRVWTELDPEDPLNHNIYLRIQETKLDDTWNYTCHARNVGDERQWNTTIRVVQRPQMLPRDNVSSEDERSTLRFGWRFNATNLTCSSAGMPHPTWTWYRRGEQILNGVNATFQIITWDHWNRSQTWLQVTPCLHTEHFIYDEYVCKATNIRGTNESKVRFQRASVPGQPILTSYTVTQSVIELDVQPPSRTGGMPVLGYELSYASYGGSGHWYGPVYFPLDASTDQGRPPFRIIGLVGGTGYQFTLAARSIVGSGTPFAFSVRTLEATRPGPVQLLGRPAGTYPYGYVLNWIPPMNGGQPLTGYRIRIRPVKVFEPTVPQTYPRIVARGLWSEFRPWFNNPLLNHYHLTNLEPDQWYQVVIEAENTHGFSLGTISLEEYGYVNRTPSAEPKLIPPSSLSAFGHFGARNLVPNWYLIRTPHADLLGRPARIYGTAERRDVHTFLCCWITIMHCVKILY